jgi:Uma2 family endonuclease
VWDGVLHMTPAPSLEHQRVVGRLIEFLAPPLRATNRGQLFFQINVFRTDKDYRIPDLTYVAASRSHVLKADGVRGEGPDAVIEIRSPDDETYEKFAFFASLGVREIIVIDRDTKRVELFRLAGVQYIALQPDAEGGLRSEAMNVRFSAIDETPPRLIVVDVVDPARRVEI